MAVSLDDDEPREDAVAQLQARRARAQQGVLEAAVPRRLLRARATTPGWPPCPAGGMVAENAGSRLIHEVRAFVAAHPPATFHPQMVVQPAGPVQSALQNREAVERDILSVTGICVLIIGLSMALATSAASAGCSWWWPPPPWALCWPSRWPSWPSAT